MPDDPTPHGGEALHQPPDRATIPEPKPGAAHAGGEPAAGSAEPRIPDRPELPSHPELTAADIEDEDADPVVDTGPGIAEDTGKPSVTQQPA